MEKNTGPIDRLIKIAVVGPESTGKSTLSEKLAAHFHTTWVREYAREYIDQLPVPYQQEDLEIIAKGQLEAEKRMEGLASRILICDTNLIVIKIWSEFKYGFCPAWIEEEIARSNYDLHLLTYIDIPWEEDPQREHPDKRALLYSMYKKELELLKVNFVEVKGDMNTRLDTAVSAVNALL